MSAYRYVLVLPITPTRTFYTYKIPALSDIALGSYVEIDIRGHKSVGVVWEETTATLPDEKIKEINHIYPLTPMSSTQRAFLSWVAAYTTFPIGSILKLGIGSGTLLKPVTEKQGYTLGTIREDLTPKRLAVVKAFEKSSSLSGADLKKISGVSDATIRAMVQAGQLLSCSLESPAPCYIYARIHLSPNQEKAAQEIYKAIDQGLYQTFLLDGVTGSGKTEVYLACTARTLDLGKQTLILLPEISLTSQLIQRFEKNFGSKPYIWHSDMSPTQRHKTWQAIVQGEAKVVVGARSALFLPYKNLGLIVVDEEHDSSYKQEDGVTYHGRDMAIVKGYIEKIPIVLGSATPSLESYIHAKSGKYKHLILKSRHGAALMPDNHLIDMRTEKKGSKPQWISPPLVQAIQERIDKKEQCLLFLNRRGYAPLTLCHQCGHRVCCPDCSSWLVTHKSKNRLACHHCGFKRLLPRLCPNCQKEDSFIPCGPGVERIAEEIHSLFPSLHLALMDRDNIKTPKDLDKVLTQIHKGEINVLIGTQMIAKGHHFPRLTLVGVIDADLGLEGGDLRACEKTYQLLHQVSGRAGRETGKSDVYLQTFNPQHPVLQAILNNDRETFYRLEAHNREMLGFPPYGRLAGVIISGPIDSLVEETARTLAKSFPVSDTVHLLGPTPAVLHKIRKNYRWRLLVKAPRQTNIQALIQDWIWPFKRNPKVRIQVDIDPYNFL